MIIKTIALFVSMWLANFQKWVDTHRGINCMRDPKREAVEEG